MNRFSFQIITEDFSMTGYKIYLNNLITTAVESSADVLQLRNKYLTAKDTYIAALHIRNFLNKFATDKKPLFIVNDRPDIAYMAKADGVHIGQDDFPLPMIKKIYPGLIVGISARTPEQAVSAQNGGANYIGTGPAYATSSKTNAGDIIDSECFKIICRNVKIPVIAIGGINTYNIKELSAYGVNGAAVISAVSDSPNPLETAVAFRKNINKTMEN